MTEAVDAVVVGAGVVGCALARELAGAGREVWVLEREATEGAVTTSRNSGVIHGGLYYPPDSLKARTCIEGKHALYDFCQTHGVAHRRCGKLVVARDDAEDEALEALMENARQSGVDDLEFWSPAQIAAHEPSLPAMQRAIWSPSTGIVDAHAFTRALRVDAERAGALFVLSADVRAVHVHERGVELETSRGNIACAELFNAAGLFADEIARAVGVEDHPIYPCRGNYFRLRTTVAYRSLVYPMRPPGYPGLGVHLTLELDGGVRLGPDAHYVDSKTDYADAPQHHAAFLEAARRLLGEVAPQQLTYDSCGLRPKLRAPDEGEERDFVVLRKPQHVVHLLGIDSPGLTAALALARVAARA